MMTVTRLFFQRLLAGWRYQYEVWKTAVDWVVALYIIVPFLAIFLNFYVSWWRESPEWLGYIPLNVLWTVIFIFAWSGTIRILVEEADQLFLLQRQGWISRIVKYSLGYSMVYNLGATLLLLMLLAPFLLLHYGFSQLGLAWLAVFVFSLKNCMGLAKQLIEFQWQGWSLRIVRLVIFLMAGWYVRQSAVLLVSRQGQFFLSILGLLIVLSILVYRRVHLKGGFFTDVSRELTTKLRFVKYMLQQTGVYVTKPRPWRKRPLLFRNSNLLFQKRNPVNGLTEMGLKAMLRNNRDVVFYLQFVGVDIVMILVFPAYLAWLLWMVFSIVLTNLVWLSWKEITNDPFVRFFPWLPETKVAAARKALFLLALPGQLVLGVVTVLKIHTWLGTLGILPAVIIIGYFSAKIVATFRSYG